MLRVEEQCRRAASNRKSRKSSEGKRHRQTRRGYRKKLDYKLHGWITSTKQREREFITERTIGRIKGIDNALFFIVFFAK